MNRAKRSLEDSADGPEVYLYTFVIGARFVSVKLDWKKGEATVKCGDESAEFDLPPAPNGYAEMALIEDTARATAEAFHAERFGKKVRLA